MFSLLLLAFAQQQPLAHVQSAEELRERRITPVVRVVQGASHAVVFIQTTGEHRVPVRDPWGRLFGYSKEQFGGQGSGVVIRKEGFIITNYHVVEDAKEILVTFAEDYDDATYKAALVSYDEKEDLALLKIQRDREFETIPMGRSNDLMAGETVIAIGNPYGQTLSVTQGIISGLHRNVQIPQQSGRILEFPEMIQTDASINRGNSGGPLLNINGELIGINSAMNVQAQNIGFAIPVDRVRSVLENQLLSPETAPAWLGFEIEPGDHLRIANVVAGSPAAKAGLKPGDCIVSVAGEKVVNQDEYRAARMGLAPWHGTEIQVERTGSTRKIALEPWDRDVGVLYERLGLKVEGKVYAARGSQRDAWLRVTDVRSKGPADSLGLQVGDLIDALMPKFRGWKSPVAVQTREQLASLVSTLPRGTEIVIEILRDADDNGVYSSDELLRGTLVSQ
jgi:serine protease Do